nr:putative reverse transcriptase domain-containing protein [Tanacetum cinerariifolium]
MRFEDSCFDNLYAVSNKEETAYLCLDFTRNHAELKMYTPYPEFSIRRIEDYLKILEDIECVPYSKKTPNTPREEEQKRSHNALNSIGNTLGKVIAYVSRQLNIDEKNNTTYDLQLGVVVFALKTWRHYLYWTKSVIYTDHKNCQHIFDQKKLNMLQIRWIKLFSDYDCEIRYHPGKENYEASKEENVPAEMLCGLDQQMEKKEDGDLYFMNRIWVYFIGDVRTIIMDKVHATRYSIHPRADKMYYDFRDIYWWPGLKKDISTYVKIPEWKYDKITMDFITKLSRTSSGHDTIWIIVDRLTKSAYFMATRKYYSMEKLSRLYIDEIVARHEDLCLSFLNKMDDLHRGVVRFEKKEKLAPRYVGPFEIPERIGAIAYRLRLPYELRNVHDTFHVLNFKTCLADASLHVPFKGIKIDKTLRFVEEPAEITRVVPLILRALCH